jgi:hypothetical protein
MRIKTPCDAIPAKYNAACDHGIETTDSAKETLNTHMNKYLLASKIERVFISAKLQ